MQTKLSDLGVTKSKLSLLPSAASGIFYRMSKRLAFFCALPLLVSTSAFPRSPSALPPLVQAEIKKAQSACEPKLPKLSPGFIIEGDVNGDGVKDYVLDYGAFRCGRQLFFCGTAGCLTQVFASLSDGGHVKVLDENVRNIKFRMLKGRPAMILDLHGTACGKVGAAPCSATLFWNGERFSPAN